MSASRVRVLFADDAHAPGRARGGETNEKALEFYIAQLDGKLNGYEAILSKQKYLAGDVCASAVYHGSIQR